LQSGWHLRLRIYFLIGNAVDSVHGSWTNVGVASPWVIMDDTVAGFQSSPEPGLAPAPGQGDLLRGGQNGEDDAAHPGNCSSEHGWCARRRHTGGGASARNGDGAGATKGRRRRVGGVGCFTGVGAAFYVGWWRGEGPGCLQWPVMKEAFNAAGYWGNKEGGGHLMGEMKEEVMRCLFPCNVGSKTRPWR
jgi:hypothetical protein